MTFSPPMLVAMSAVDAISPAILQRAEEWLDSLATPVSIVILAAGFAGLLVGWLLGTVRLVQKSAASSQRETAEEELSELQWRHEKLILSERQESERRGRLQSFLNRLGDFKDDLSAGRDHQIRIGLFGLAELVRDLRHQVGTDLSRLSAVDERLSVVEGLSKSQERAVHSCRELAERQQEELSSLREVLRPVSVEVCGAAESFSMKSSFEAEDYEVIGECLRGVEETLGAVAVNEMMFTLETEKQMVATLKAADADLFAPICRVLLVDGGAGLPGPEVTPSFLQELIASLLELLPSAAARPKTGYPLAKIPTPMRPDTAFLPPKNGTSSNGHSDKKSGKSAEEPSDGKLIVFRSSDVSLWNSEADAPEDSVVRPMTEIPGWAKWISMSRLDTGERVFAPTDSISLSSADLSRSAGFNATNERFYGAHHLGMFSETCPNEVETRFTYGGWGFGHRVSDDESGEFQASGWAGVEIDSDTVFEVVLHKALPELKEGDTVLGAADLSAKES